MPYQVVAYRTRYLSDDVTLGLPGGTVTLALPGVDVPAAPNVLLVKMLTVSVTPPSTPEPVVSLYDVDPTQGVPPAPAAFTENGNLDQGSDPSGIVIPSGGNLFVQWVGVAPGGLCQARVQFEVAEPDTTATAHPILSA